MPETAKEAAPSSEQMITAYMMAVLEHSLEISKRQESRSERAIQLFLTLFTTLAAGGVIVATTVQDPDLKNTIFALDLGAITGMGVLTYIWVLASVLAQNREWVARFHVQRFFYDLAPDVMEKYGRGLTLKFYQEALYHKGLFLGGMTTAASFSLIVFVVFNSITAAATVYTGLLALVGTAALFLPVAVGILCFSLLLAVWRVGLRNLQKDKDAARIILGDRSDELQVQHES